MANESLSPNMSLPIPNVGIAPGPDYATDVNNSLTTIDQHDHSPGSGVQITSDGISLTSNLPLNNNSLTLVKSINLQTQSSLSSVLAIYTQGVDLWFNNAAGTPIQLTSNGAVAGTPGAIANLVSPASASYVAASGVFVFQSDVNVAADIDGRSLFLRNNVASSKALNLIPPNAMGADYTLTLPPLPVQTNVMTIGNSGSMSSITYDQVAQLMTFVGADAIASKMTSAGSNEIVNGLTSPTFTVCDLIGLNMSGIGSSNIGLKIDSTGADSIAVNMTPTGANTIATTMNATGANAIASTMTSTGANAIASTMTGTGANTIATTMNTSGANTISAKIDGANSASLVQRPTNLNLTGNAVKVSGSNIVVSAANTGNNMAILRGGVGGNGMPSAGEGFTSSRISTGSYSVVFNTPFAAGTPLITVTPFGAISFGILASLTPNNFVANFYIGISSPGNFVGDPLDTDWSFIVVGEKA